MVQAGGYRRVYKYKGQGPGSYTDYKCIVEPGSPAEKSMFDNPLAVRDPILVYDDGRVLNTAAHDEVRTSGPVPQKHERGALQFDEIREVLYETLRTGNGRLWSAYQVCKQLRKDMPEWWKRISDGCPPVNEAPGSHRQTDVEYSVEVFVLRALEHFLQQDKHLVQKGAFFPFPGASPDVEPGATDSGTQTTVWTWRPAFLKTIR
jgi:hypothetical protein